MMEIINKQPKFTQKKESTNYRRRGLLRCGVQLRPKKVFCVGIIAHLFFIVEGKKNCLA